MPLYPKYSDVPKKTCTRCDVRKPNHEDFFRPKTVNGKYKRTVCRDCETELAIIRQTEEEKKMEEHDRELLARFEKEIRIGINKEFSERFRARISGLHEEITRLREDLELQQETIKAEQLENSQLISQVSDLEEEKIKFEIVNNNLEAEAIKLVIEAEEADEIIEKLETENGVLKAENERLKKILQKKSQ